MKMPANGEKKLYKFPESCNNGEKKQIYEINYNVNTNSSLHKFKRIFRCTAT